jgi:two-component system, NarL family, sensor histidine kinase UhpB
MMNELEQDPKGNPHQIILLKNIITYDENERLEISYSLNENIAQMLAATQLHIKMAKKKITEDGIGFIEEAEAILKEAIWEVKTLASSISPFMLKNIGFISLLHDLILLIEDHHEIKCDIHLDTDSINNISIYTQNILYQIAQLQTINILKCKTVEKVFININEKDGKIVMLIKDNGIRPALNIEKISEAFTKLKERVEAFDGKCIIDHQNGCSLEVTI